MKDTLPLSDQDIRNCLIERFVEEFKNQKDTIIVKEMGLCRGKSRIDLAIINGIIHGIEIKSDLDTIKRLEHQIDVYKKTLDKVTLYVGNKLIDSALEIIPNWWGVVLISKDSCGQIQLQKKREPKINKHIDPFEILQLLWKEEALGLIDEIGLKGNFSYKSRDTIFETITSLSNLKKIQKYTVKALKERPDWPIVHSLT